MKSSPLIWRYVVNVKETVSISSIFVAFLDNMNFNEKSVPVPVVFPCSIIDRPHCTYVSIIFYVIYYLLNK